MNKNSYYFYFFYQTLKGLLLEAGAKEEIGEKTNIQFILLWHTLVIGICANASINFNP
jgi:hypothetical protein